MSQPAGESPSTSPAEFPAPRDDRERLELARSLFRLFRSQCFWHCRPDLEVTEADIPLVIKGLRTHGGRRGFMLAAKLQPRMPCPYPPSSGE